MLLKKGFTFFILAILIFSNGFSQDCSVDFFLKSYTGDGFKTGGSQGDRLTFLPDSSMIICSPHFISRISKKATVLWTKSLVNSGVNASNAVVDYDGNIVCVMGSNIVKYDTSGNLMYQKNMTFNLDNGYDVTNSQSFRDIGILSNGDKIVLYQDNSGTYGGYLFRFDRDMKAIKWCKNIRYDYIHFTNIIIEGSKIVIAGISQKNFDPATFAGTCTGK